MERQAIFQSSENEQTIINIMRKLPAKRASQLIDFAKFLEFQITQKHDDILDEETEKEVHASEERWDKLFAKPEAKHVMREMAREARETYQAGKTTGISTTEDGQLTPK